MARPLALLLAAIVSAALLAACGSDSGGSGSLTGEEVTSAYEEAADGYPFEKVTSLVDGAAAYGPKSESDPALTQKLEETLGESSLVWQVAVFEGEDPPTGEAAAKKVAFSSDKFEEAEDGVWLGDHDFAYVASGNAVANGPVLGEALDDETMKRWRAVLDSLND